MQEPHKVRGLELEGHKDAKLVQSVHGLDLVTNLDVDGVLENGVHEVLHFVAGCG